MKKVELLAPAGDQESLIAAIQNGADAIYLGGSLFNARAYAKNFDNEQLKWAVHYAHLREVKIYVTVNTLYKDEEIDDLIKYIDNLYNLQVDALIIQDLGLFYIVKNRYPDFEIHISTQASVMNVYSARYFEKQGAGRVVLARENTIEEIKEITENTDIEVEAFIHGAMCVCYSGQCLMSSMIGKRSGNRGQCAQPCRLEYKLKKDNEIFKDKSLFLLSPKDLMTIDHIGELIEAGVTSLKIEGRMKRPEYVASVVKAYRKAIDHYFISQEVNLTQEKNDMKQMFNRDYTQGYLFHDHHIVDGQFSGNRGIIIGKVIAYNKQRKRVLIQLTDRLKQGDSILFESIDKGRPVNKMFLQNKLINEGQAKDRIEIEFDYFVKSGNVRKIIDKDVIKRLQQTYQKENKKLLINMSFEGHIDHQPILKLKYNDVEIIEQADILCEKAKKTALDQERIKKQLSKLGNTVFQLNECSIHIDENMIIPIKTLNELRRQAIERLEKTLENKKIHKGEFMQIALQKKKITNQKPEIDVIVSHLSQLQEVIKYPVRYIYYPYQKDIDKAYEICQNAKQEMVLFIPRIMKTKELKAIKKSSIYQKINKVLVNEMGAYDYFAEKERILGTGCNIYNSYALENFNNEMIASLEMTLNQINEIKQNMIIEVYGKAENMISEYCPISQYYHGRQIKNCQKCKEGRFAMIDRKNEVFDIMMDEQCRMHLLNSKTLYFDKLHLIKDHIYLLHFTNEDQINVKNVLNDYFDNILNNQSSSFKNNVDYTLSYFQ